MPMLTARYILPGNPSTPDEALAFYNTQRKARRMEPVALRPREGSAFIRADKGRWVADCDCGSGMAVFPELSQALCLNCGSRWDVKMPARDVMEAAEAALDRRPARRRDWDPWRADKAGKRIETPAYLDAETELMSDVPVGIAPPGRRPPKDDTGPKTRVVKKVGRAVNLTQLHDEITTAVAATRARPFEDRPDYDEELRRHRPGRATISVMGQSGDVGVGWVEIELPPDASDATVAAVESTIEAHRPRKAGA
jgi:hypothetical protein